jgi:hypothetical protein
MTPREGKPQAHSYRTGIFRLADFGPRGPALPGLMGAREKRPAPPET